MRFAVLGDVHYVRLEGHGEVLAGRSGGPSERMDTLRNGWSCRRALPALLREVRAASPQLVIQTGDLVQGHCDGERAALKEMAEALALMEGLGCPVVYAPGTHDGAPDAPQRRMLMQPAVGRALGRPVERYYAFEREECLFLALDYTRYRPGGRQAHFARHWLSRSRDYRHCFVFAHPPLIPVGRPFFTQPEFAGELLALCAKYPVDAYFCGHTHNQLSSVHNLGDRWLLQLQGAATGFPEGAPIPYQRVRPFLPPEDSFEWGWAWMEDSPPGWLDVQVEGEAVQVDWHVLGRGVVGHARWRGGERPVLEGPPRSPAADPLPPPDQVRAVRLRLTGSGVEAGRLRLTLNGHVLENAPWLEYFDSRRLVELPRPLWPAIGRANRLSVRLGEQPAAVGAFVLEAEGPQGWARSGVSGYFANDARWAHPLFRRVAPGERVEAALDFAPAPSIDNPIGS